MNRNSSAIRLLKIATIICIWYGLGLVAESISLGNSIVTIIDSIVIAVIGYALIDGRLFEKLQNRPVRGFFLVPMFLIIATIIYDVFVSFRLNNLFVLDQLHIFGLISYIRAAGLLILTGFMLWETITFARDYFQSKP